MRASDFRRVGAVVGVAVLLALALLHARSGPVPGAHLDGSDCALCHLAGKNVTAQQAAILVASQETLCGKCHPAAIQVSHPTGFAPKAALPAGFPLDWKGDLTCSTCHAVHASGHGLMRSAQGGKTLCLLCHQPAFFSAMRDGGNSLTSGHLARAGQGGEAALDAYSRKCLECHGSNAVARLATSVDRNGVLRHASEKVNHPIGMSYQKASAFGGYRARKLVEKKLFLPDGKVACISCHAGYQQEHGKLVIGMARSQLCFECHDL
ncbi:MAG: cytochrome c3 family protein [Pseudomonadota bacterium]